MTGVPPLCERGEATLQPDAARVIARLFLPGEELKQGRSRAAAVADRVMAVPEDEVQALSSTLVDAFAGRHLDVPGLLGAHAAAVRSHVPEDTEMSPARTLLLGACFTAEYAVEAAALCNPSAVLHPDQDGLEPGAVRAAVSLRGIGEGHLSSIGFASAVVGPGRRWEFETRQSPVVAGLPTTGHWHREHLRAILQDHADIDGLAQSILSGLPDAFSGADLQHSLETLHPALAAQTGAQHTIDLLRALVASAYDVAFAADLDLSQQVLMPSAEEESNGMEDARFVRFVGADGSVEYRATYTAYDGRRIAPRLLTSPDLRSFRAHRLAGPAARNKGMALFPRLVDGRHAALCRSDGESTSLTFSDDGFTWESPQLLHHPVAAWEALQVGNCGPPLETESGWLVLTHGVGPMRTYAIGALLLDLDDPSVVRRRLVEPLLQPLPTEQDGYVPNVVYSCGGMLHDGLLWIPYGVGDARIAVASVAVSELLAAMVELPGAHQESRRRRVGDRGPTTRSGSPS